MCKSASLNCPILGTHCQNTIFHNEKSEEKKVKNRIKKIPYNLNKKVEMLLIKAIWKQQNKKVK